MVKISKTYIPKEKEKYMCTKHLAFFKKKLTDWKTDLIKTNNELKNLRIFLTKIEKLKKKNLENQKLFIQQILKI